MAKEKFKIGETVICTKDVQCEGYSREIKKGEILEIKGIGPGNTYIWFTITCDGGGAYDYRCFEYPNFTKEEVIGAKIHVGKGGATKYDIVASTIGYDYALKKDGEVYDSYDMKTFNSFVRDGSWVIDFLPEKPVDKIVENYSIF